MFVGRETNENKRHAAEWCNFCNSKVRVGQHNTVKAQKVFQGSDCVVVAWKVTPQLFILLLLPILPCMLSTVKTKKSQLDILEPNFKTKYSVEQILIQAFELFLSICKKWRIFVCLILCKRIHFFDCLNSRRSKEVVAIYCHMI